MKTTERLQTETPTFSSSVEEIEYLRKKIAEKEAQLSGSERNEQTQLADVESRTIPTPGYENAAEQSDDHVQETVRQYVDEAPANILSPERELSETHIQKLALDLEPESHDGQMDELLAMMGRDGIKNTLSVVAEMNNAHLEDDFHRVLVQFLKSGNSIDGLKEKAPLGRALHKTLFEIVLPLEGKESKNRSLEELVSAMEQFYAGILSVTNEENKKFSIAVELAVNHVGEEVSFYCAVPDSRRSLCEKQLQSLFPDAEISEIKDDYNVFNYDGVSVASYAQGSKESIYPIKTYNKFDHDPLQVILNAFSRLEHTGEGAAIQMILQPAGESLHKKYVNAMKEIEDGKKVKDAINIRDSFGDQLMAEAKNIFWNKDNGKEEEPDSSLPQSAQSAIERIQEKTNFSIERTNLRIVSSASSRPRAEKILFDLESAFSQFEEPHGNKIEFTRVKNKKAPQFFHNFSFRLFDDKQNLPLNIREITSLLHFPVRDLEESRELKQAKSGTAPAPLDMPKDGILVGINKHRGAETEIRMTPEDRLRHFYTIGQTGTGKTSLLRNMIVQDIRNGDGCCFIDPHGSDVQDILANIPPERYEDVIYFDPSHTARPIGLNMLEYDKRYPEQKTFVVNEMLSIFNKLFDMGNAGGPMFEQYFRNATMLVLEDPESGSTLLEISRVLSDEKFRKLKLSRSKNPIVNQFWQDVASKAGGEASLENIVPYVTSKFDNFLSNEIMRPIIAQEKSSFNFREVMDSQKILLVNLSKGRLGDINANLLGLILVGKILMAALSRVDVPKEKRSPFYLYIDEFQNVTTNSISQILSEARKYGLSLNIAHQFIAQLQDDIRDAVFGNVGSMAAYRVSSEDADFLESQFEPVFDKRDLMNIDNYNSFVKMLVEGTPVKPFSMQAIEPDAGRPEIFEKLKELSYLKYGRQREQVEADIMKKYQSLQ